MTSSTLPPLGRFDLPGSNLPVNYSPRKACVKIDFVDGVPIETEIQAGDMWNAPTFPNALDIENIEGGWTSLPLTPLREFTMLRLMNAITDKPNWEVKVFDETIAGKWKIEALSHKEKGDDTGEAGGEDENENDDDNDEEEEEEENNEGNDESEEKKAEEDGDDVDITEAMVDWCIEELRFKAKIFQENGTVVVYNGDVVKSDSIIPDSIKEQLKIAVKVLENVPEHEKDYHPGSDGQLLDLVHPSLFPLIYGRSRILPQALVELDSCIKESGKGNTLPYPPRETQVEVPRWRRRAQHSHDEIPPYSQKFQWLPCDIEFTGNRGDVRITSYVNNLHPRKHQELYKIIESVISHVIPMWNITLRPLGGGRRDFQKRIKYYHVQYDPDPENLSEDEQLAQLSDEDEEDFWERREEWADSIREVVLPEPEIFTPPDEDEVMNAKVMDLRKKFADRGLQIIVKLANIELTPEKHTYEGGTWHVEGQLNEHICATALYYYSSENITESVLAFRQQSSTEVEVNYRQSEHDWLPKVFGCEQGGPGVQNVGSVVCKEGRALTFPNILQHKVESFRLADQSLPGHRKILALFLVDPNIRIISTANIPPQQLEWWSEDVMATGVLNKLSGELVNQVFKDVEDFPISLEEAKEMRLELMEERKKYVLKQGKEFESTTFSLCEH